MNNIYKVYDTHKDFGPMPWDDTVGGDVYIMNEEGGKAQVGGIMGEKDYMSLKGKYIQACILKYQENPSYLDNNKEDIDERVIGVLYKGEPYDNLMSDDSSYTNDTYLQVGSYNIRYPVKKENLRELPAKIIVHKDKIRFNCDCQLVDVDISIGHLYMKKISDNVEDLVEQILKEEGKQPTKEEISQHPTVQKFKKLEQEVDFENLKAIPEHLKGLHFWDVEEKDK